MNEYEDNYCAIAEENVHANRNLATGQSNIENKYFSCKEMEIETKRRIMP